MKSYNQTILKQDAQGNVIQDSYFEDMTFRGEYTGTNLIYKGYARTGSSEAGLVWQIAKLEYDGSSNILSVKWPQDSSAHASSEFVFSWTARASYTYS